MKTSLSSGPAEHPKPLLAVNHEAERCVLGPMITDSEILRAVLDSGLRCEHFCLSDHRRIFEAIVRLTSRALPVDFVTVAEELETNQDKSNVYVLLADWTFGLVLQKNHILYHAAIVHKKSRLRRLQGLAEWIRQAVTETADPNLLVSQIREQLDSCSEDELRA